MNHLTKRACLTTVGILLILAFCVLALVLRQNAGKAAAYTACVYLDGRLLQSIPLDQVTETRRFTVDAADGGYNIVEVSPGGIAIAEADCPDQICVNTAPVGESHELIVCMPNRITVEVQEN